MKKAKALGDASEIDEFLSKLGVEKSYPQSRGQSGLVSSSPVAAQSITVGGTSQWSVLPDNKFQPCGPTIKEIPAGAYRAEVDNYGRLLLGAIHVITDELLRLPDTASDNVLRSIQVFWGAKALFKAKGQLFKRGILLWGPPGSGKTVTVMQLAEDIIKREGIVIVCANPELATQALEAVRRIEPERPLICVMEDIDELISNHGEAGILSLLDGENQVANVVHIATTNYPERLDARLVNRPSRFDEVIKIGMPSAEARRLYFRSRVDSDELPGDRLEQWVDDTDGMSIAHLRELVVAVFCLARGYDETIARLRSMKKAPVSSMDRKIGLVA